MNMAKYSVHQQPVETLLSWIKSGDIAIPEEFKNGAITVLAFKKEK